MTHIFYESELVLTKYTNTCPALTHWGRVTHLCVSKLTSIASDNGLSPGRRQAIIWNNAGILLIGHFRNKLQWNFNRNSNIFIQENAFESVVCETAAILSRPQWVNEVSLWGVSREDWWENWPCYNGIVLYEFLSITVMEYFVVIIHFFLLANVSNISKYITHFLTD